MPKVIALIPARSGSKGVPNKNIHLLGGHPLLAWTIMACKKAKLITRIVLSTDSNEYASLASQYEAEVPFLRPAEISGDRSTDYEFVAHAIDWFLKKGEEPDYIVHMRPTTPFRDPLLIDEAINTFIKSPEATALRSVHEMSESAYKTFEIDSENRLKRLGSENTDLDAANNARQGFPKTYSANGYVDVLSVSFVRQSHLLHGNAVKPFVSPVVTEVDTRNDFEHLEYQLLKNPEFKNKIFGS